MLLKTFLWLTAQGYATRLRDVPLHTPVLECVSADDARGYRGEVTARSNAATSSKYARLMPASAGLVKTSATGSSIAWTITAARSGALCAGAPPAPGRIGGVPWTAFCANSVATSPGITSVTRIPGSLAARSIRRFAVRLLRAAFDAL